jgi:hypothetical protein
MEHCYLLWFGAMPPFRLLQNDQVLSGWRAPTFTAVRREVEKTSVFLWGAGELQAGQIHRGFPWFRKADLPNPKFAPCFTVVWPGWLCEFPEKS